VIPGRATPEGTRRFAKRSGAAPKHFRDGVEVSLSSIGLGTYLGNEDDSTDRGYEESVAVALASGVNVFDTAINYRGQRSERAIGRALSRAIADGAARRDELFVSTKGGYLPHDSQDPREPRAYILETFVESGLAPRAEIARGGHCLSPAYVRDQIARSRANLGLETIDLYYLHNVETQKSAVGLDVFRERMRAAIEVLEESVSQGRISAWGLATWDGLRAPPEHPEHLGIADLLDLASEVAGSGHHFRAVQLPVNLAMSEAIGYPSQPAGKRRVPALERLGRAVSRPSGRHRSSKVAWPRICPRRSKPPSLWRVGRTESAAVFALFSGNDDQPRRRFLADTRFGGLRPGVDRPGRPRSGPGAVLVSRFPGVFNGSVGGAGPTAELSVSASIWSAFR
jgi:aryl-alcohol dehydrogenase-like predicted oxidoreductase